ncbi:MAG: SHOCT domain-containing protein [Clostridiales bacterium]|nr:SHOCT domain-containing protein [Clostridiales bacterium]
MEKSKLEKLLIGIPIGVAFFLVGIFVLSLMQIITLGPILLSIILICAIICFGCISCLNAQRMLIKDKKNIYAYVMIGLTALTCLLWIIFIFLAQSFVNKLNSGIELAELSGIWGYTKATIFITIQTSFANLIISNIYTLKKSYLTFQIVQYVSNFIFDLWLSIIILAIGIDGDVFVFNANWLLDSKFIATIVVMALAFTILSSVIMKNLIRKRNRDIVLEAGLSNPDETVTVVEQPKETVEERIKKLDDLKEKGMITEEEYNSQRAKILEEI